MTHYNKLIRDKIPDLIKSKGETCKTRIATDEEYWDKLKEKLVEEVNELIKDNNIEELADVLEVIDSIKKYKDWHDARIEKIRLEKKINKGGFDDRIILISS